MDQITPVAWVIIILLLLFIIGLNVNLFNAFRNPNRAKIKMDRTSSQTMDAARKLGAVLRDPLANERNQLNELSDMVHQLEEHSPKDQNPGENPAENGKKD